MSGGGPDLVAVFLRWIWLRAALHKGWWLVTSVYLVVDAGLSPSQLVLIGAAQAATALVFEIPAGVVADTLSRKWALVLSHLLMGTAMIATGLVTDFGPLVATQMLWGLSWTLASGADVAWITDELDEPARISVVLVRSGRAQLTGAAAGIVGLGALASVTQRTTTMILAGAAMLLLGLYVVVRFREQRFVRCLGAPLVGLVVDPRPRDRPRAPQPRRSWSCSRRRSWSPARRAPSGGCSPGGWSTSGFPRIPSPGSPSSACSPCSWARPPSASSSLTSTPLARRCAATPSRVRPEPSGSSCSPALPRR